MATRVDFFLQKKAEIWLLGLKVGYFLIWSLFFRRSKGPVIHLLSVPPSDVDLMPPAPIRDLRIQVLPKSGQLMATWTAPGDDYDVGAVTGYRFVIAHNYSNLLDPLADQAQTLVGFQQPDQAGVTTSYQFGMARIDEHYGQDLFLGKYLLIKIIVK